MGISGLIPFLEKASETTNIKDITKNTCVAIDAYCWLHKGAFACADILARGDKTDVHINYCLKYVQMLLSHGIKPILVFDGRHLPAKALTEKKRRENRKQSKTRAAELLRLGKVEEARSHLRRCVDITHAMALQLIQECRSRNVDCIVAPYEADGQLAYLNLIGIAEYVITEDSDLILFGCKKILFKLDLQGNCLSVNAADLYKAMGCRLEKYNFDKFRFMCVMSGCDYLDSLPGIGLAKSCKFVLKTEDDDVARALSKIPAYLNMRHLNVTDEYKEQFLQAIATFQHMVVYDPLQRRLVRLNDPEIVGTDAKALVNAGAFFDESIAFQLALGNLDPFTLKALDNWLPSERVPQKKLSLVAKHKSIWQPEFRINEQKCDTIDLSAVAYDSDEKHTIKRVPFKSTPKCDADNDDETCGSVDMLAMYGNIDEPATKKAKLNTKSSSNDIEMLSPNKKRNPFGTVRGGATLTSPTKITKTNSSFLKQCSPVKRVSPKCSLNFGKYKINRTVLDGKQEVLSRFFVANHKLVADNEQKMKDAMEVDAESLENRVTDIAEKYNQSLFASSSIYSVDSDDNSPPSEFAAKENGADDCIEENEFNTKPSPKMGINVTDLLAKASHRSTTKEMMSKCRQPGLSKAVKTLSTSGSSQSRLSMFGFKKKSLE